jgi:tetratricopeptide (TPR) repeat protein
MNQTPPQPEITACTGVHVWVWLAALRAKRATNTGRQCLAQGDLKGASAHFDKALRVAPGRWESFYWAGCVAGHQGDYATAHGHFTSAVALDSSVGQIFTQRGYSGIHRADFLGALRDLRTASQLGALDDLGRLALGALELQAGRPAPAQHRLQEIRRTDLTGYREALLGLAVESSDPAAALAHYSAAIGHGVAADPVLFRHAVTATRVGDGQVGHASFRTLAVRHPAQPLISKGAAISAAVLASSQFRAGEIATARRTLQSAARHLSYTDAPWLSHNLALSAYLDGDVGTAARFWESMLTLEPDDIRARTMSAICQVRLGAVSTAYHHFTALTATKPGWPRIPAVRTVPAPEAERAAWHELGSRLRLAAAMAAAEASWDHAGALTAAARPLLPGTGERDRFDALLLLQSDNRNAAVALLAQASRKRPADTDLLHMRGVALLHTLRSSEAKAVTEELWRQCVGTWAALLADDAFWSGWKARTQQRYQASVTSTTLAKARDGVYGLMDGSLPVGLARLLLRRELEAARALRQAGGFPLPDQPGTSIVGGPLRIAELGLHAEFGAFTAAARGHAGMRGVAGTPDDPGKLPAALPRLFSALGMAHCLMLDDRVAEAIAAAADLRCADCRKRPGTAEPMVCAPGCPRFAADNPAYAGWPDGPARLAAAARPVLREALLRAARSALTAAKPEISAASGYWRRALALADGTQLAGVQRAIADLALGRADALQEAERDDEAIELLSRARELVGDRNRGRVDGMLALLLNNRGVGRLESGPAAGLADLRRATELNPHDRLMWLNRIDAEKEVMTSGPAPDPSAAARALEDLESTISEAMRCLPGDREISDQHKVIQDLRLQVECMRIDGELDAAVACLDRRDPAGVRQHLKAGAAVAVEALLEFPSDPDLTKRLAMCVELIARVGR